MEFNAIFLFWGLGFSAICGTLVIIIITVYNRVLCKRCNSNTKLHGKTVIITGASAGIGKEAAADFAQRGARVILACRNLKKAQDVADVIKIKSGNVDVVVKILDTSSLSSVRAFAKDILSEEKRLDILALNAGTTGKKEHVITEDCLETTMATNHFGHFLLVNLLLGLLKKSAPSRVVITSSQMHNIISKLDAKDINFENMKYSSMKGYTLSKLCNVLTTRHLAAHHMEKGVTFNAFCPGLVRTEIFDKTNGFSSNIFYRIFLPIVARTPEMGAQTLIYLAVSEDVKNVTGGYFLDCKERVASKYADDAGIIKKIWEKSEDLVNLTAAEKQLAFITS